MPLDTSRAGILDIDAPPTTDPSRSKVTIDGDGSVTIEIGGTGAEPDKPKSTAFGRNLAEDVDSGALASLAEYLIEGVEADIGDRAEWEETIDKAADYLGINLTDPAASVAADGTICQAVASCMLEVALKLWGSAYAELYPTDGPVKVKRADAIPPPPGGGIVPGSEPGQDASTASDQAGDDLAQAFEDDFNWYLTVGDRGYYPDGAKMLMNRLLVGMAFREVFDCPIARKPLSRWVMAQDLIVQGSPCHLSETDGRVTVRKKISRARMKRMQKTGYYLDVPLIRPTGQTTPTELTIGGNEGVAPTSTLPRDYEHMVYEINVDLGAFDEDMPGFDALDTDEKGRDPGFPLPYRVTVECDSRQVLRIVRNWKQGDEDYRRKRRYVKYGFMPAFGDGFYDWGLLHLVGNPTQAATMLQRSGVDAGILANFPAWMVAQGAGSRLETTVFRPGPGDAVKIPTTGGSKLSDVIMPWPYKEPSAQSMALVGKLEADVKAIGGIVDLPIGEGRIGNTPVGTIMSYIESVSMVPGAIHKMDHVAQAEEFQMLRELIAQDPEVLWRGNPTPARKWQVAEEVLSQDLSPRSDPNTASQIHRLLKIQGLIMLGGLPQFAQVANNRWIYQRAVEVLTGLDAAEATLPEPPPQAPPPDPRVIAAQIKAQSQQQSDQAKIQGAEVQHQGKMEELSVESSDRAADRDAENTRELMKAGAGREKNQTDLAKAGAANAHDAGQAAADRTHDVGLAAMDHAATTQQQLTAPAPVPTGGDNGAG